MRKQFDIAAKTHCANSIGLESLRIWLPSRRIGKPIELIEWDAFNVNLIHRRCKTFPKNLPAGWNQAAFARPHTLPLVLR